MQIVPPTEPIAKRPAAKSNGKGRSRTSSTAKQTLHLKEKHSPATIMGVTADVADQIATAAYYLAEQRGFAPGHELDDWLVAEQQVRSLHS